MHMVRDLADLVIVDSGSQGRYWYDRWAGEETFVDMCATDTPILENLYRVTRWMKANHSVSLFLFSSLRMTVCVFDKETGPHGRKRSTGNPIFHRTLFYHIQGAVLSLSFIEHPITHGPTILFNSGPCSFPHNESFSLFLYPHIHCIHIITHHYTHKHVWI